MHVPRIRTTVPFGLVPLTALLFACASTRPQRYWIEFEPTYSNFKQHFDERGQDLDPIEGIWSRRGTMLAIVRDSTFDGYDYVGVSLYHWSTPHGGEIVGAYRRVESDSSVYEYIGAAVLRREKVCSSYRCHDICVITAEGTVYRQWSPGRRSWWRYRNYPPP